MNYVQKYFFLFVLLTGLSVNTLFAQEKVIRGYVSDPFTNENIAFASIYWKNAKFGVTCDVNGFFELKLSSRAIDTLVASYVGYENTYFPYNQKDTVFITLTKLKAGTPIVVKSKKSLGWTWWSKIVAHADKNNPYQYENYAYQLYNKLEIDINNIKKNDFKKIKALKPFAFIADNIDSTSETKSFLPIFLSETISNYYYSKSPRKIREEINALQISGINNESILQFLGGVHQKVNVYDSYILLFGKEFISPVGAAGDKYYYYRASKDTVWIDNEKYIRLLFSPLREGSNTFSGECWVNSNNWGVYKITIDASSTANINHVNRLSIIQEFRQNEQKKWVFYKDKLMIDLSPLSAEKLSFTGRKTALYKNVQVNQDAIPTILSKNSIAEEVIIHETAKQQSKQFWEQNRYEQLSISENKVYTMIDTLKKIPLFKTYSENIEFIFDGHKKLGKIEIGPWFKWISGNQQEQWRLRFDLGTTKQFSPHLRLYGYVAYGIRDERWKGKLGVQYRIPNSIWRIEASYLNDLDNGRVRYNDNDDATIDNMFSQLIRRPNVPQKFLSLQDYKWAAQSYWTEEFTTELSFARTIYHTFFPFGNLKDIFKLPKENIINTKFALLLRYAPGEKLIKTHRRNRKIKKINMPIIEAKYTLAVPNLFQSQYAYQKLSTFLTYNFRIPRWGMVHFTGYAGKYWGENIPFMLLEVHPGNEIYYYNKDAFNLMNRYEYFSDTYAGMNLEYNFEKKLINILPFLRKLNVRQFVNVKTAWGTLTPANKAMNNHHYKYAYALKGLEGYPYTEVGTGLDNIFKYFRLDFVWRLERPSNHYHSYPAVQNFGVFGSFRLQF